MRMRTAMTALAFAAGIAAAAMAAEQAGPAEVIKMRQEQMKALGADFRIISDALKTDAPDMKAVGASATRIAQHIQGLGMLYPAGTGPDSGVKTRALAEIWAQPAEFKALGDASIAESAKFAKTAAEGKADWVKSGFKVLTDSCVACHNKFRGPEEKKQPGA